MSYRSIYRHARSYEKGRSLRLNASGNNGGGPSHGHVHTFRHEYNLRDHLGNLRTSFTDADQDGKPEITQEQHYEAYGLRLGGLTYMGGEEERYLYNGKERIGELNLGLYDYGFRWADFKTGRFVSVDPLAEKFYYLSTYQYASCNPVTNIDLDGLEGVRFFGVYTGGAEPIGSGELEEVEIATSKPQNTPLEQARMLRKAGYGDYLTMAQQLAEEHYRNGTNSANITQKEVNQFIWDTFVPVEANFSVNPGATTSILAAMSEWNVNFHFPLKGEDKSMAISLTPSGGLGTGGTSLALGGISVGATWLLGSNSDKFEKSMLLTQYDRNESLEQNIKNGGLTVGASVSHPRIAGTLSVNYTKVSEAKRKVFGQNAALIGVSYSPGRFCLDLLNEGNSIGSKSLGVSVSNTIPLYGFPK